jgi:hypothetical protein
LIVTNVKITKKDGTIMDFPHRGRAGGSYTVTVRFEGAFVIVRDEWGKDTAVPAADVEMVESEPHQARMGW